MIKNRRWSIYFLLILFASILFFCNVTVKAANIYYIREGAVGSGDGSDWANAWNDLPDSLERGAIYYIATGTYGPHVFADEELGTELISIKKAAVDDHGTDNGWDNSYAEGQALFTADEGPIFRFNTGYYTIDGQTGEGKSRRGIRVYNPSAGPAHDNGAVLYAREKSHYLCFEQLEIDGGSWMDEDTLSSRLMYLTGDLKYLTIRNCYVYNASVQWLYMSKSTDILIEHNYFENCMGGMGLKIYGSSDQMNVVIRYNYLENTYEANNFIQLGEHNCVKSGGYDIYGNVFLMSDPTASCRVVISNCGDYETYNVRIYNNTFFGFADTSSRISFVNENDSNIASNNLWVNCDKDPDFNNIKDLNNSKNVYNSDIFVDPETGDFHLAQPVGGATDLGDMYQTDPDGKIRGVDGSWDYGAYDFSPDEKTPPIISQHPETQAAIRGNTVIFKVAASGNPAPTYQWYFNGEIIMGEKSSELILENVQPGHAGKYIVNVSNSEGDVSSEPGLLLVAPDNPDLLLQMGFEGTLLDGTANGFDGIWSGNESYVNGANGLAIDTAEGSYVLIDNSSELGGMDELTITVRARKDNPGSGGIMFWKHTQYHFSISSEGIMTYLATDNNTLRFNLSNLDIAGNEWHHYAFVYDGQYFRIYVDGEEMGSKPLSGSVVSKNTNIFIGRDPWGDTFKGQLDDFQILTRALNEEEIQRLVNVNPDTRPPSIIRHPVSQTVMEGEDLVFTVLADGYPAPTYQWQKDENDIPGAVEAELSLTDVKETDTGDYRVKVSNDVDTVISNPATLTVIDTDVVPVVERLTAMLEYYTAFLSWENPEDSNTWDDVVIIRKKDEEPTGYKDGEEVYTGRGNIFIDRDLEKGRYYYAAYCCKVFGINKFYSELLTIRVDIPEEFNKSYLKVDASHQDTRNINIGQTTRGDLYSLWNADQNIIGRGPTGNEISLWLYSDIIGNGENLILANSKIVSARLVLSVEDFNFTNDEDSDGFDDITHSLIIYRITDPDNLGIPIFADESGIRVGLDYNYRDHRPGMNIPWLISEDEDTSSNILDLLKETEPVDTIEFSAGIFEDEGIKTLEFDLTEAVQAWSDGEENQGIYITTGQNWNNGEVLKLYGISAEEVEEHQEYGQSLRPYLEITYGNSADNSDLTAPEPVQNLKITQAQGPDTDNITLNWTNPDDIDFAGVKIVRSGGIVPFNHMDGNYTVYVSNENETNESYTDSGLTPGKTYYYALYAYDEEHNYSEKVWVKTIPGSPAAVQGLNAADHGSGTVHLSWISIDEVSSYNIYRKNESAEEADLEDIHLIVNIKDGQTQFYDYVLEGEYTYWVSALNDLGEGPLSEGKTINISEDSTEKPTVPTGFNGSGISGSKIRLYWTDSPDESGYLIERKEAEDSWENGVAIAELDFDVNTYIDSGLIPDTGYMYRIKAVNMVGESDYLTANLIRTSNEPVTVKNISWNVISASQIKVSWEDTANEDAYIIELFGLTEDGEIDEEAIDTQNITANISYCYFVNLEPGREYIVRVTSINDQGDDSIESDIIRTSPDPKGGLF